ncbi:MAG: GNAT family N-acetyltransferase [Hyphomicrobiaceae bacterium]|nr:GNAT family N-acetyltransferase [Hyphomicrobiaceae bacterium]
MTITYQTEPQLQAADFIDILVRSGLAQRRPADNPARIAKMLENADLVVTARNESGLLVGIARSITDWSYCLYCSDLAVDKAAQGKGIGKALLAETARLAPEVKSHILLSAPAAVSFYEHAGYQHHPAAFLFHVGD